MDGIGESTTGGGLSGNEALPWSLELIERFEDRWDLGPCRKGPAADEEPSFSARLL